MYYFRKKYLNLVSKQHEYDLETKLVEKKIFHLIERIGEKYKRDILKIGDGIYTNFLLDGNKLLESENVDIFDLMKIRIGKKIKKCLNINYGESVVITFLPKDKYKEEILHENVYRTNSRLAELLSKLLPSLFKGSNFKNIRDKLPTGRDHLIIVALMLDEGIKDYIDPWLKDKRGDLYCITFFTPVVLGTEYREESSKRLIKAFPNIKFIPLIEHEEIVKNMMPIIRDELNPEVMILKG